MPPITDTDERELDEQMSGLDALELAPHPRAEWATRLWSSAWPKLLAVAIALFLWQLVVWSGWKPEYVLPGPKTVFQALLGRHLQRHHLEGHPADPPARSAGLRPGARPRRDRRDASSPGAASCAPVSAR